MAVRDASSALTLTSVLDLYRDVWSFAKRPQLVRPMATINRIFLFALAALFALDLALAEGVLLIEGLVASAGHDFPDELQQEYSFADDFLLMVLIGPAIEEMLFRGWLSGRIAALRFAAIAWTSMALLVLDSYSGTGQLSTVSIVAYILLIVGLVQWSATKNTDTHIPEWFVRHFAPIVWLSTLAFGLVHLGNFEGMTSPIDLIIVSSQTIGGLILAYTRTRLGLTAAIGQHAAFNLIVLVEAS